MKYMTKALALFVLLTSACVSQVTIQLPNGLTAVPAPTFSPNGGTFGAPQAFTISESQSPATIIWTPDGTTPSPTNGTQCTSPCSATASVTESIRAIAVATGYNASIEGDAQFNITGPTATPTFSVDPGTSANPWTVAVSDLTASAVIYCTTDGTTPTTGSPVYSTPFTFNTPGITTLKCAAKAPSLTISGVMTGAYNYQPPAAIPVISPAGGRYTLFVPGGVTITDSCSGSVIYVTTDGTTPTTSSPVYSGAISVTQSSLVQAMATCPLYAQSLAASQNYTILIPVPAPTPTLSPNSQTVTSPATVVVTITDAAAGATIYITTDGSTPTTSSTVYSGPITVSAVGTEVIKAIATAPGALTSLVGQGSYTVQASGTILPCPQTSGPLTVPATSPRSTGISPLLVFFNATGTTDSSIASNRTTFTDVTYTWNFGDSGASGAGTWAFGSNPGDNSMNSATGAITAHLYITNGADVTYTASVTAQDAAGNTVTCSPPAVTVHDPIDAPPNGFGGVATTCAANVLPTAGVGGCPVGATALKTASFSTALNGTYFGSGKRVLFKCGDTFTGDVNVSGTKWSIGAYGGCEGTQINRPIITGQLTGPSPTQEVDGRVSDLDFESTTGGGAVSFTNGQSAVQITLWNLLSHGNNTSYYWGSGTQFGLIGSVQTGMKTQIGTFANYVENQCVNGSTAYNCGGTPSYVDVDYNAIIGNSIDGKGATASGFVEAFRTSACRLCVYMDNIFANGANGGAPFKLHDGNPNSIANNPWIGQYVELIEIADNYFTGNSGCQLVEVVPQNAVTDERARNIVVERNLFNGTPANCSSMKALAISANNATVRDNIFANANTGISVARRGIEWNGGHSAPSDTNEPEYFDAYNNTCSNTAVCVNMNASQGGWGGATASGSNATVKNNMLYISGGGTTVSQVGNTNSGTNTVSNNTTNGNSGNNPAFVDSCAFTVTTDFQPTTNYTGGTSVPVIFDASGVLGVPWSPTWALGALHP